MKRNKVLSAICFTAFLSRCASIQVDASFDKSTDFTKYRTFNWYPSKEKGNLKYFGDLRIRDEVRRDVQAELESRGMRFDEKNPDLLVEYHGTVDSDFVEERGPIYSGMSYGYTPLIYGYSIPAAPYYGGYYAGLPYGYNNAPYGMVYIPSHIEITRKGTLILDLVDRKTNQLVWRGWATEAFDKLYDLRNQLASEIRKLLKKYPVPRS